MSDISIITSMYNKNSQVIQHVENLLFKSLLNQNSLSNIELILLDDASPLKKETKELYLKYKDSLENLFGNVSFNRNNVNLGFAGAYNRGMKIARGRDLIIVNDDVYFPKNSIQKFSSILDTLEGENIVGPITCESTIFTYQYCKQAPKLEDYSCKEFEKIENFANMVSKKMKGKIIETDLISGFCFAVSKKVINQYGGFDPSFGFGYFEDFEFIRRMKNKGIKVIIDPSIYIHHGGINGASNSTMQHPFKANFNIIKNLLKFQPNIIKAISFALKGYYRAFTGKKTVSDLF
jgi:GT2 family glycosyltransferase